MFKISIKRALKRASALLSAPKFCWNIKRKRERERETTLPVAGVRRPSRLTSFNLKHEEGSEERERERQVKKPSKKERSLFWALKILAIFGHKNIDIFSEQESKMSGSGLKKKSGRHLWWQRYVTRPPRASSSIGLAILGREQLTA